MQTLRADSISIHVVCLSVIILVVLDMMLADAATLMDLSFTIGMIYFVISAVGFMVAFFVLNRITSKRFRSLPQREQLIKIAFGTFIAISFFFLIIIIQILFTTKYQTNLLIVGSNIAYMTSCLFMVMLTHKFFAWYQSSKNLNLLLYGISTTSAAVFFIIVSIYYSACNLLVT